MYGYGLNDFKEMCKDLQQEKDREKLGKYIRSNKQKQRKIKRKRERK